MDVPSYDIEKHDVDVGLKHATLLTEMLLRLNSGDAFPALRQVFHAHDVCVLRTDKGLSVIGPVEVVAHRLCGKGHSVSHAMEALSDATVYKFLVKIGQPARMVEKSAPTSRLTFDAVPASSLSILISKLSLILHEDILSEINELTGKDWKTLVPVLCCALISMADKVRRATMLLDAAARAVSEIDVKQGADPSLQAAAAETLQSIGAVLLKPSLVSLSKHDRQKLKHGTRNAARLHSHSCVQRLYPCSTR